MSEKNAHFMNTIGHFTFEQRTQLAECSDWTATGVLANRQLHEQHRDAAHDQNDEVWYQKHACKPFRMTKKKKHQISFNNAISIPT